MMSYCLHFSSNGLKYHVERTKCETTMSGGSSTDSEYLSMSSPEYTSDNYDDAPRTYQGE